MDSIGNSEPDAMEDLKEHADKVKASVGKAVDDSGEPDSMTPEEYGSGTGAVLKNLGAGKPYGK